MVLSFYDFQRRRSQVISFHDFQHLRLALEVLGKNGCFVEGVLHLPGTLPVKLDSQDLLQIGDKEFYFLLLVRSVIGGPTGPPRHHVPNPNPNSVGSYQLALPPSSGKKSGRGRVLTDFHEDDEMDIWAMKTRRVAGDGHDAYAYYDGGKSHSPDKESDNQQLLQLEENDVVPSVATVLSDFCGPGEWMPMEKLHTQEVSDLTSDDNSGPEAQGKPWFGLVMLLRKYPEHFIINTRSRGRVTLEFVSLLS
ncbi:hypothetical protein L1987_60099 [Smallanthus sonchifolius]|uniref:Uncharacterized protein n=1 Tax=Smallanthus sonchifolius TaxID=185202 RepID=A0ACB9D763_9ASTR|nr:hypothetical protein L1987_60099 [Smallanthus sonchifolius]